MTFLKFYKKIMFILRQLCAYNFLFIFGVAWYFGGFDKTPLFYYLYFGGTMLLTFLVYIIKLIYYDVYNNS